MKACLKACIDFEVSCPNNDCRNWIYSEKHLNCVFKIIEANPEGMDLEEIGNVLCISKQAVFQIEEKAIRHIRPLILKKDLKIHLKD
jgi:hypothetical protein